jgi:IS30 family transposase
VYQDIFDDKLVALSKKRGFRSGTIYQFIYADKLSGGTLYQHLLVLRKSYRKRYGSYDSRGKIKNRVCIEELPAVIDRLSRIEFMGARQK